VLEALVLVEAAEKKGQTLPGDWAFVRRISEQY
jgi:hypothetical protein